MPEHPLCRPRLSDRGGNGRCRRDSRRRVFAKPAVVAALEGQKLPRAAVRNTRRDRLRRIESGHPARGFAFSSRFNSLKKRQSVFSAVDEARLAHAQRVEPDRVLGVV
jgi:hypothetical protein